MFTARHGLDLNVIYINPSKPTGHYMYRQFNIQQFYIPPTQCVYVFCVDLRTNSDYFPITYNSNWFVFELQSEHGVC